MKKIILNLLNDLQEDPNLLTPMRSLTPHAMKAQDVLIKMYESVPEGEFITFIREYVRYHVIVEGNIINGELKCSKNTSLLSSLKGVGSNSIIYMLYSKYRTETYYIGSASNAFSRLSQHQDSIRGLRECDNVHRKLLSIGRSSDVMRGSVYTLINYSKLAVIKLPNYQFSQGEAIILRATTEFILRILEQSLITEFGTPLNNTSSVLFTHTSWDPGLLTVYDYLKDGSRAVQITSVLTGELIRPVIPSISQAADLLQISRNIANRYLQSSDGFFSGVFGCQVALGLVATDLHKKHIVHRASTNYPTLTLPGGPLEDLEGHVVWVFYPNKTDFIGPFVNYTAAARELNPSLFIDTIRSPSNISVPFKRIANYEKLLSTQKGQFYIAYNPKLPPYNSNPQSKNSPLFNKSLPNTPFKSMESTLSLVQRLLVLDYSV